MYAISAQQTAILATGKYTARMRAQVQDAGGTYRNLSQDYGGWDFQLSGSTNQGIDDSVGTFELELKREVYQWSLAPLMTGSAVNLATYLNPSSSYSPLLDVGRKIKLEFAILPLDAAPAAADWALLVEGYVDTVDPADGANIHVTCRDLGAHLGDTFIQDERVYGLVTAIGPGPLIWAPNTQWALNTYVLPTILNGTYFKCTTAGLGGATEPVWPGSGTVGDGAAVWTEQGAAVYPGTGVAVQSVMQNIITDAGLSDSLSTPVNPGWFILSFKQQRQSVLDALRQLVQQIGWDLRYLFDTGAGVLTFYQPTRTSPTVQYTFAKGVIPQGGVTKCGLDIAGIRNRVRVVYNDSQDLDANGFPKRKYVQVDDATSQTRFGGIIRFMEISEDWTSKIDTSAEATTMATACLNDLSSPIADYEVEVPFFPFASIGDYYTFKADGLHFDVDQSFGIVGIAHTFQKDKVRTKLTCRGKPSGGYKSWHDISASPSQGSPRYGQAPTHALAGFDGPPTYNFVPTVTGGRLQLAQTHAKESDAFDGFEFHVSSSNASPPSSATLTGAGKAASLETHGLNPNNPYYWAVVPLRLNGSRRVRGQPSAWQSFQPLTLNPIHILPYTSWVDQPPNADFGSFTAGSGSPPDRWSMQNGTWGTNAVRDAVNIFDGLYSINIDSTGQVQSDYFPVKPLTDYMIEFGFKNNDNTATPQVNIAWYSAIGTLISTSVVGGGNHNAWTRRSIRVSPPSTATFARLSFSNSTGPTGKTLWIAFCRANEVRTQETWNGISALSLYGANVLDNGAPDAIGAYFKDLNGLVKVKGFAKTSAALAALSTLWTAPAGYRPLERHSFAVRWVKTGGTVESVGAIEIASTGAVLTTQALANADKIALDCMYLAEQ